MKTTMLKEPVTITSIEAYFDDAYSLHKCGGLVSVRPCDEACQGKTYLGVLLGDLQLGAYITARKDGVLEVRANYNPAMFVPSLHKIVFGCESWWHTIETPEALKQITDADIDSQWYVKAFMAMAEEQKNEQ